jgi:hypothetical protein
MKNRFSGALLLAGLCSLIGTGCAAPDGKELDIKPEREYRTGSNLPVKDRREDGGVKKVDPGSLPPSGPAIPTGKGS